jgi:UDP-N-acetylmuramyl-tripeptide synthetase
MKLSRLLGNIEHHLLTGPEAGDPDIASLHYHSRSVLPGGLFVAIRGQRSDGHDFLADAGQRGAAAIVVQKDVAPGPAVTVRVPDTRRALAMLADRFYEHPSESLAVIALTGTNGKTTVSYIIEAMLLSAGLRPGVIGTINYRYAGQVFDSPVTTPESLDLQRILGEMRRAAVTHVVVEVSSHALDLHRVDCCRMDVGVFTNLSQDHLDFHGSIEAYWKCKKRLFLEHLNTGPKRQRAVAVINTDDPRGRELCAAVPLPCVSCGSTRQNKIWPTIHSCDRDGTSGRLHTPRGDFAFASALVGQHNIENILCAVGAGEALGLTAEAMQQGIERLASIPGRLEQIPNRQKKYVYVDYAHTPEALRNVLKVLRGLTRDHGKLICIFGCGGDRDRAKRPLMGEIAGRLSDVVLVTSDNPRSEDPAAIIAEILPGLQRSQMSPYRAPNPGNHQSAGRGFLVEADRAEAIRTGLNLAAAGDTVLIAGKGHETYQIVAGRTRDFDDRQLARSVLE